MSKTVYIAARFSDQKEARNLREYLRGKGFSVTARWIDEEPGLDVTMSDDQRRFLAKMDVLDVRRAQALVLVNNTGKDTYGTGGCHTEVGLALGMGIPVIVFGPRTNIFMYLPQVQQAHVAEEIATMLHGQLNDFEKGYTPPGPVLTKRSG